MNMDGTLGDWGKEGYVRPGQGTPQIIPSEAHFFALCTDDSFNNNLSACRDREIRTSPFLLCLNCQPKSTKQNYDSIILGSPGFGGQTNLALDPHPHTSCVSLGTSQTDSQFFSSENGGSSLPFRIQGANAGKATTLALRALCLTPTPSVCNVRSAHIPLFLLLR